MIKNVRRCRVLSICLGCLAIVLGCQANGQDETADRQTPSSRVEAVAVTTVADEIDAGAGGLAINRQGMLFTADFGWRLDGRGKGGDQIFRVDPQGNATLFCRKMRGASGNAMDSNGNLFQSSIGGNFISKVTPDGEVSVFARQGFRNPVGIAIDPDGNLFVCNCGSKSIQKVSPDGTSTEFCKSNLLNCPNGIALAADGTIFISNFANGDVIRVSSEGKATKLATIPGKNNGHLTLFENCLYVVARSDHRIYQVTMEGQVTPFVGSGKRGKDDGRPLECSLSLPNSIVVGPHGKFMYFNETSPTTGDPRILGPTRIRRIELGVRHP